MFDVSQALGLLKSQGSLASEDKAQKLRSPKRNGIQFRCLLVIARLYLLLRKEAMSELGTDFNRES